MNQEQISYWEKQKNGQWKILTNPLKNNSEIHSQFDNFIAIFYQKFNTHPEINFEFDGFKDLPDEGNMGHCEQKKASIDKH